MMKEWNLNFLDKGLTLASLYDNINNALTKAFVLICNHRIHHCTNSSEKKSCLQQMDA